MSGALKPVGWLIREPGIEGIPVCIGRIPVCIGCMVGGMPIGIGCIPAGGGGGGGLANPCPYVPVCCGINPVIWGWNCPYGLWGTH